MDDTTILYLAILSLGLFIGVLVTTYIYVAAVRPRLLAEASDDRLYDALDDQMALVRDLQQKLEDHHRLLDQYATSITTQQQEQRALTDELRTLRSERRELQAQLISDQTLRTLLSDHHALLQSIKQISGDNRLRLKAQQRLLSRQLHTSQTTLQRLIQLMDTGVSLSSEQLADLMSQIDELGAMAQKQMKKPAPVSSGYDRLTDIKGIGPVSSGILHEAGIHTFQALADTPPDMIIALLNRTVDAERWIRDAQALADQQSKG